MLNVEDPASFAEVVFIASCALSAREEEHALVLTFPPVVIKLSSFEADRSVLTRAAELRVQSHGLPTKGSCGWQE
jgi:hypothetical protein